MSEKIKQILVMIATSGVVFVNYLAADGIINNKTTGELAEKYTTDITPVGYAFSIWGLIYLGLIAFSIYQALPTQTDNYLFKKIRSVYVVNCIANCAWIYAWHYEHIPLSGLIMLILLGTLVYINIVLVKAESAAEIITTKVPFNIYFGWITVA
ncbi:MAG: tryptophan-rich sensory protein, partial [Aridibacter sp.]